MRPIKYLWMTVLIICSIITTSPAIVQDKPGVTIIPQSTREQKCEPSPHAHEWNDLGLMPVRFKGKIENCVVTYERLDVRMVGILEVDRKTEVQTVKETKEGLAATRVTLLTIKDGKDGIIIYCKFCRRVVAIRIAE